MNIENKAQSTRLDFPIATMSTADMIKSGVQAFRMPDGSALVTREWISNNIHLFGGAL